VEEKRSARKEDARGCIERDLNRKTTHDLDKKLKSPAKLNDLQSITDSQQILRTITNQIFIVGQVVLSRCTRPPLCHNRVEFK